eukprot:355803-Chlamydomonas_euryale.AAC.1
MTASGLRRRCCYCIAACARDGPPRDARACCVLPCRPGGSFEAAGGPASGRPPAETGMEGVNEAAEALIGLVGLVGMSGSGGGGGGAAPASPASRPRVPPGRVVWAKVEGHDWWPAKVVRRRTVPKEVEPPPGGPTAVRSFVPVVFFADSGIPDEVDERLDTREGVLSAAIRMLLSGERWLRASSGGVQGQRT